MQEKRKILLVQLYSNGDCLYATTIAKQIKKDFPGCHLTWAIASFCKSIIAHNPDVDEIREINDVPKNDIVAFRKLKRKIFEEKKLGMWSEVFITHNMDENQALYDGTIRGMIFRAYPFPVTVSVQPMLKIAIEEKEKVKNFAEAHKLKDYKNVILWEYAPQSGQSNLTFEFVMGLAKKITNLSSTCVILSSAKSFVPTSKIIDASGLSVRENAELTHYCSLLIGCSSGITWLSTSNAAKQLPMIQLLNSQAFFLNAPSVDFERNGISSEYLIELIDIEEGRVYDCVRKIIEECFAYSKERYHQQIPLQFNTTRKVVYNLLCYLQFNAITRHYRIMTSIYGRHPEFIKQFILAFTTAPFKLIGNFWRKKLVRAWS